MAQLGLGTFQWHGDNPSPFPITPSLPSLDLQAFRNSLQKNLETGVLRFTLGIPTLVDGVSIVSVALGCFGIAEITKNRYQGLLKSKCVASDMARAGARAACAIS